MQKPSIATDTIVFLVVGGLTLIALVLIALFTLKEQEQNKGTKEIISYSKQDQAFPQVKILDSSADLGKMNVKDEKTATFPLKNTGTRPLQVFNISSSCNCTFGKLTIEGVTSPEFSMHTKSPWVGTIEPGKEALLSVIYRPSLMPVKGVVTRQVLVQTNDPENEQLTFTVKALVE